MDFPRAFESINSLQVCVCPILNFTLCLLIKLHIMKDVILIVKLWKILTY